MLITIKCTYKFLSTLKEATKKYDLNIHENQFNKCLLSSSQKCNKHFELIVKQHERSSCLKRVSYT